MKQAALASPGNFESTDVEPPAPAPGDVLVRVRAVGVCGSDLHFFRGEFPTPPGFVHLIPAVRIPECQRTRCQRFLIR